MYQIKVGDIIWVEVPDPGIRARIKAWMRSQGPPMLRLKIRVLTPGIAVAATEAATRLEKQGRPLMVVRCRPPDPLESLRAGSLLGNPALE